MSPTSGTRTNVPRSEVTSFVAASYHSVCPSPTSLIISSLAPSPTSSWFLHTCGGRNGLGVCE